MIKKTSILIVCLVISLVSFGQQAFNIKYGPYLQNVGENEATVVWVTSKNALSWVEVAPNDDSHFYAEERPQYFETVNGRKLVGTVHKVTIKGLKKGTKYRYRAYSREVLDNLNWDTSFGKVTATSSYQPFSFTTLDSDKKEFSFAVVNDIHADTTALENLLNRIELEEKDFVVFNGDMVSFLNSEKMMFDGFLNKSVEMFAPYIPFVYARGNHETRGPFSTQFMNYFPSPTGKPYYTFRQGPAYFIVLDSGEDKPDTDIEYGSLSAFDEYREEQAKWLQEVVDSDEFKQAPVKMVVVHVPAFTSTWHGTLHVEELFIPILNKAGIDLMFSGHTHRYSYIEKGAKGNNFPLIVNGNRDIMDITVKGKAINVVIKDRDGKVIHTFNF